MLASANHQQLMSGILVSQTRLPARHRNLAAVDEYLFYIGSYIERISVRHHNIGSLAGAKRTQLVGDSPNFRSIQRNRFKGFVTRQVESGRITCCVRQVADVTAVVWLNRTLRTALEH